MFHHSYVSQRCGMWKCQVVRSQTALGIAGLRIVVTRAILHCRELPYPGKFHITRSDRKLSIVDVCCAAAPHSSLHHPRIELLSKGWSGRRVNQVNCKWEKTTSIRNFPRVDFVVALGIGDDGGGQNKFKSFYWKGFKIATRDFLGPIKSSIWRVNYFKSGEIEGRSEN